LELQLPFTCQQASKEIRVRSSYFRIAYRAVVFSQYVIAGIMLITVLQIVLTGKYSLGLLILDGK